MGKEIAATRIEILDCHNLARYQTTNKELYQIVETMSSGIGWHYPLDYPWALFELVEQPSGTIVDAGCGSGNLLFWLAEKGYHAIGVDLSIPRVTLKMRLRFAIKRIKSFDVASNNITTSSTYNYQKRFRENFYFQWRSLPYKFSRAFRRFVPFPTDMIKFVKRQIRPTGTITFYRSDLRNLSAIADNSVDAVISISAIEHNKTREDARKCVRELMRILKPRGRLIATTNCTVGDDWFHKASKGWCYNEDSIRYIFDLPGSVTSNFGEYEHLFTCLVNSQELQAMLHPSYSYSGNNGMPWGVWKPLYQPVGIVKVKQ